jgi:hypothetical protein
MKNHLLTQALKVSQEELEDVIPADQAEEVFSELSEASSPNTIEQVMADENEVGQAVEQIEAVRDMVTGAQEDDASMESLNRLVDVIGMRYGQVETTSLESLTPGEAKQNILARLDNIQTSLESALVVSQESWSVKDLWNSAGAVERNTEQLNAHLQELRGRKEWFSEHGLVINSVRVLNYITVNNKPSANLVSDTNKLTTAVKDMIAIADTARELTEKIAKQVSTGSFESGEGVEKVLSSITSGKNPAAAVRQKLDGLQLLGNTHYTVSMKETKSSAPGEWNKVVSTNMELNDKWHGGARTSKASLGLRIPAWLVGYTAGTKVGGVVASSVGMGVGGIPLVIGYGLLYGYVAADALNAHKTAKDAKHSLKFEEVEKSFREVVDLANKTSQIRRGLPGAFKRAVSGRDEVAKSIGKAAGALAGTDRQNAQAIRDIYMNMDRLAWKLYDDAFRLMLMAITNSEVVARKMVKASKK